MSALPAHALALANPQATLAVGGAQPGPTPALPVNLEAEAALIGAMLCENRLFDVIADRLEARDFFEPLHGRVFEAVAGEVAHGRSVTPTTLRPVFEHDPAIAELGGISYLAKLTGGGEGLLAPKELAEQVADLARRRRMIEGLAKAVSLCLEPEHELAEAIACADAAITERGRDGVDQIHAAIALANLIESFGHEQTGVGQDAIPGLDELLGPLLPKQLVILASRPGMGKTATALSYAIAAAEKGHGVLFVSLEMSARELAGRIAADMCFGDAGENAVPFHAINKGRLNDWQHREVLRAQQRLLSLPLEVVDTAGLKTGRLASIVRRNARRFEAMGKKLELVVVDYLQLLRPDVRAPKLYEAITEVSVALKTLAKENALAVLALAQLSRETERRGDKRPVLSDLRDSGQLEQDADAVLFLYRDEYYHRQTEPAAGAPEWPLWNDQLEAMRGRIEFILAKRRNGPTGKAVGTYHLAYQAVRE